LPEKAEGFTKYPSVRLRRIALRPFDIFFLKRGEFSIKSLPCK
jgi:hypothetical protein